MNDNDDVMPSCDTCSYDVRNCRCDERKPLENNLLPGEKRLSIEQICKVCKPGEPLIYSPYGYVITEDGTTYCMYHQWQHGMVCAILFPELAKQSGFYAPVEPQEDNNVYVYQRFELDHHDSMPIIRICPTRMIGPPSVNKSKAPATKEQIDAVRLCIKEMGLGAQDEVNTDYGDMTVEKLMNAALPVSSEDYWTKRMQEKDDA